MFSLSYKLHEIHITDLNRIHDNLKTPNSESIRNPEAVVIQMPITHTEFLSPN